MYHNAAHAVADAKPAPIASSSSTSSSRAEVIDKSCKTIRHSDGSVMHICDFRPDISEVCIVPVNNSIQRCCRSPGIPSTICNETVTFCDETYTLSFFKVPVEGTICYVTDLPDCAVCGQIQCTEIPQFNCSTTVGLEVSINESCRIASDGFIECDCKPGYVGRECCACNNTGFFRVLVPVFECQACNCCTNGTVNGADQCDSRGECLCEEGYSGEKCCIETIPPSPTATSPTPTLPQLSCSDDVDVYMLVDTTASYGLIESCRQAYVIMQIAAALSRSSGNSNAIRLAVILYSERDKDRILVRDAEVLFGLIDASNCASAIDQLNRLIEAIFVETTTSPVPARLDLPVSGAFTYPEDAINVLTEVLRNNGVSALRRNVAVILTDGANDGSDLPRALDGLRQIDRSITIVGAGLISSNTNASNLSRDLKTITMSSNVVVSDDVPTFAAAIFERLRNISVICSDSDVVDVLRSMTAEKSRPYCNCITQHFEALYIRPRESDRCSTRVKPTSMLTNDLPTCGNSEDSASVAEDELQDKDRLEQEILAAVEEVLKHHG